MCKLFWNTFIHFTSSCRWKGETTDFTWLYVTLSKGEKRILVDLVGRDKSWWILVNPGESWWILANPKILEAAVFPFINSQLWSKRMCLKIVSTLKTSYTTVIFCWIRDMHKIIMESWHNSQHSANSGSFI